MDIDLNKFNIKNFSIEYFHLNKDQKINIIKSLYQMVILIMVLDLIITVLIGFLRRKNQFE